VEQALAGHSPGFRLVGWTAGSLRSLELGVCPDERPGIVGHGLVFTLQNDNEGHRKTNFSDSVKDRLALSAAWVVGPTPQEIEEARLRTAMS
jgi:hypothetical protein